MEYRRPPITEAIIELRFAREFDRKVAEAASKAVRERYFYEDAEQATNVVVNAQTGKATTNIKWFGFKLSSIDRTELVLFRANGFLCSCLAPYPGWSSFRNRAREGWEAWKRAAGPSEFARIGVRYINRIDIPTPEDGLIYPERYLTVGPASPDDVGDPMASYTIQTVRPLGADQCGLTINTSSVPSPLIGFTSFALDIDVYRDVDLPKKDADIWDLLERIRTHKNRVFEKCITENSRDLFNQ